MITRLSVGEARSVSSTIAVPPPTLASAPGTCVDRVPHPVHGVLRRLAVRPGRRGCPGGTRAPSLVTGGATLSMPVDVLERGGDLVGLVGLGDHDDRLTGAGREVPREHLLADDRVGLAVVGVLVLQAVRVRAAGCRARRSPSTSAVTTQVRARAGGRCACRPAPRRRSRCGRREPYVGRTGQKTQRPKITSRAGSRVSMTSQGDRDADGGDRAEALGGVHAGEQQAEHAGDHRRAAGEDRGAGAVQRERHRLVPVLVAAQLLAVARDQQQGVVGPGAEDQHGEDAGALRVDGQAELGRRAGRSRPARRTGPPPRRTPAGATAIGLR